ncbi:MAG: Ig-like domain-containing protein, partial [Treponema sp.]|nr:Ig-like domain-containing protein [Treponema sp.]
MADNSENPFKESIEEAVWEATAPRFEVRVQAAADTGTTTPVGGIEVKQRVPFHILFTPSADYFFIRWAAYNASNMAEYGADIVIFASPGALETDVTIDASEGSFLLQPVCVKRPTVSSKRPGSDATNVLINQPLSITFDSDIAPESFIFPDGSLRTGDADREFNNISIIGKRQSDETQSSYTKYFKDWEYKNRTLLIRIDGELPLMADISIVLNKNIYMNYVESGINYQVTMAANYAWSFSTGTLKDTAPPYVEGIAFGTSENDTDPKLVKQGNTAGSASGPGNDLTQPGDISLRRFNSDVIYVAFRAYDSLDADNVPVISVKARHYEDNYGNLTGYDAPDVPNPSANSTSPLAGIVRRLDHQTGALTANKAEAVVYVVPYNISSLGDGVIEFAITLTDQQQNTTNTPEYPPYKFYIVRDKTPPYSDPANITVSTDITNTGWINSAHPNIRFMRNGAYDIVDTGSMGPSASGIKTWSNTVQWAFGFSNTAQPTSWAPVPLIGSTPSSAEIQTITADSSTPDGVVPMYLWLRDDLNTAAYPFANPVKKDTVVPVFDSLAVTGLDANSSTTADRPLPGADGSNTNASITHDPTVTYGAAVRDPGDDASASKLAAYYVVKCDKGAPEPTAPAWDAGIWTPFGTTELTNAINGTISLDLGAGDGVHEVWLWVKDTAGNVSSPSVRKVVLDRTAPAVVLDSISMAPKFYLKKGLFD